MAVITPSEPEKGSGPFSAKKGSDPFSLFALGFRPLYLFAGAYAALSVPLWALQYAGLLPGANPLWHAHEMLFGYAFAVIAGFLLTAVRVWTQRPTPTGLYLMLITALWIGARVTAFGSLEASSVMDLLFAVSVAIGIGIPIVSSGNRNWFFIVFILALGLASVAFQAYPQVALAVGLDVVLLVVSIMGGRVIPAFTNSAVPGAGARRNRYVEWGSLGCVVLILVLDLVVINPWPIAFVAAALHAVRVALWAPRATLGRPILWILHLSYAWVAVHLVLRGLAGLDLVPAVLATHALTVGVIGGLTLGMMTRTSRGHTARPLKVGNWELAAYVLVHLAAVARVFLPLIFEASYAFLMVLSGGLWSAAFAIFTIVYIPILTRPRLDGNPG